MSDDAIVFSRMIVRSDSNSSADTTAATRLPVTREALELMAARARAFAVGVMTEAASRRRSNPSARVTLADVAHSLSGSHRNNNNNNKYADVINRMVRLAHEYVQQEGGGADDGDDDFGDVDVDGPRLRLVVVPSGEQSSAAGGGIISDVARALNQDSHCGAPPPVVKVRRVDGVVGGDGNEKGGDEARGGAGMAAIRPRRVLTLVRRRPAVASNEGSGAERCPENEPEDAHNSKRRKM
eukprot:PhM_4_TR16939/c0_g1_i1/m.86386